MPVPFQHHTHKPGFFNDKLVLNLKEKISKKEVDEWWKSIPISWRGLRVHIVRHGELKGRTAIVHDVAFGCKNLSSLATFVELETFESMKWWIKYEDTVEEQ